MQLSKAYLNDADILKELDIANNLNEVQAPTTTRDTIITYREVHARPRHFDLFSNIRGGHGQSLYGHLPRKPSYNTSMRGSPGRLGSTSIYLTFD